MNDESVKSAQEAARVAQICFQPLPREQEVDELIQALEVIKARNIPEDEKELMRTFLKMQEDHAQAIKERDQARDELEEIRKKKNTPNVERWKSSVTAMVTGFMRNGLTLEERQSIVTRLQDKTRADFMKMWADSKVLGDAENAFWAGFWADIPEHLRPGPGRPRKT